jgi:membrane associated rhomboid family serine protease
MLPIRDDQPRYTTPYINYFIIGLNVLVYVLLEVPVQMQGGRAFDVLISQLGLVPHDLTLAVAGNPHYPVGANILTIFTSMFMHGGLFHIAGNLWFLWIFGDNVEDYLGHFPYLIFYLLCGVAAALTDVAIDPRSAIPMLGASGAIAGVMGAYIILYPRARVQTLVVLIVFITFWWLPAWVFLGYWFLLQFVATSVMAASVHHQAGGVAFAAHVGGFVVGLLTIKLFPRQAKSYRYSAW